MKRLPYLIPMLFLAMLVVPLGATPPIGAVVQTWHYDAATNNAALQRLLEERKASVASTQMANEIIRAALADPNDADPATTAAKEIQDRITVWKAQKHTTVDFEPGVAKGVVDELRAISSRPLTDKRNALTQYLTKSEKRLAMFSPHAELTKIGGPQ